VYFQIRVDGKAQNLLTEKIVEKDEMSRKFRAPKYIGLILAIVSVLLNIYVVIELANQPSYKLGTLSRDINIADFNDDSKILFKLPKGLTVMDASPRGIASAGMFGLDRFTFTVIESGMRDDGTLVNYSRNTSESNKGALYYGKPAK
jgi:hypothetical protein